MNLSEGWPTQEMIDGGWKAFHEQYCVAHNRHEAGIRAAFEGMFSAAPTPPTQEGYEYRDRWGANMLSPGPWLPCSKTSFETMQLPGSGFETRVVQTKSETPPAQEDEPVAWLIPRIIRMSGTGNEAIDGTVAWEACVFCDTRTRARIDKNGSEFYPKPLYTRPDDRLRKAAEGAAAEWRKGFLSGEGLALKVIDALEK